MGTTEIPKKHSVFLGKKRPHVFCYLDETSERLVASSKTNRFLDNKELSVEAFDEVDLIVSHPSDLGMNVIVNKTHLGLIFNQDLIQRY